MISTAILSAIAFLSTNIDDIFMLTLLFSAGNTPKYSIYAGQFLGITALTIISRIGAYGLSAVLEKYIFLLGIIPILLGIKAIFDKDDDEDSFTGGSLTSVFLLTLSAGGDNIGIYTPLFAGMNSFDFAITLVIFGIMSILWCFMAQRLSSLPSLRDFIKKYKRIIVPVVFITLGIFIILGI